MDTKDAEVLEFVSSSLETIKSLNAEKEELQNKIANLETEKVKLEKVASEQSAPFSFECSKVDNLVNSLVTFNIIEKSASEEVSTNLKTDPNYALFLLDTLVKTASSLDEGSGVDLNNSSNNADPHGWYAIVSDNKQTK